MNRTNISNFNLEFTLLGGQAFNWDKIDGIFYGFTQDKVIKLQEKNNQLYWQTYPEKDNWEFLRTYLQLDLNYQNILNKINKDETILKAINSIPFVRLLKQDFEQTLLSFILSSHKNIKAVRKCIRDLSKKYGNSIKVDGDTFYLFPTTEKLNTINESELKQSGMGFRSVYLKNAVTYLSQNKIDFTNKTEEEARETLLALNGVGDKIADCVLVFSLGYYTVTPIDIWGKRVLTDLYKLDAKLKYPILREWYKNYFGEHTAWAGQFLFEYLRLNYKIK